MPLQVGSAISRAEYNSIQAKIESVLGDNGANAQFGYGRALTSSQITTTKVIESEDMLSLYNDLVKARRHQKGTNDLAWTGDGLNAPSDAETIGVFAADVGANPLDPNDITSQFASSDTDEGFADFDNAADDIITGHDLVGPAQMTVTSGATSLRDTQWGGNDVSLPGSSINHTVTVTWQNADERRYFFNSGGEIHFSGLNEQGLTFGGSEGAKTINWRSILSTQGTVIFGKSSTAANGTNPGSGSNIGNYYSQWSNTSSSNPVTIYTKNGSGVYADNYYTIKAWQTAANSIRFDIIFQDADLGEGGPAPDTPVDEFVEGETSSYVNLKTAEALGINAPTVTNVSTLDGTASNQASMSIFSTNSAGTNITEINEGGTVVFKIQTANISSGTQFSYTISGTGVTQEDISLSSTSGTITLDASGEAEVSFSLTEDETTETVETLTFTVSALGGVSKSITVNDTSQNVQGSLFRQTNIMNEGDTVGYWMASGQTEINGETFYWDISDSPADQWINASGSFVYDSSVTYNAANPNFTITAANDNILDDYWYASVNLRRYSSNDPIIDNQGINVYNTTEDPFTFKVDTAVEYDGDGLSAALRSTFDDTKVIIAFKSDTGQLSDVDFRIRPISGGTLVSPNFGPDTWFNYTATTNAYAKVAFTFSAGTVAEIDVRGRGAFVFGTFTNFSFKASLGGDQQDFKDHGSKVIDVVNWGREFEFVALDYMFDNCPITELTDSSSPFVNHSVTNTAGMFHYCKDFTGLISGLQQWDVSNVTTMEAMFKYCTSFNGSIGGWSTQNVTDMAEMFFAAHSFNQNIGGWITTGVTDMTSMFECNHNNSSNPPNDQGTFNQDISGWDVTSVTGMNRMFWNHQGFNQDLTPWCVTQLEAPPGFNGGESVLTTANLPIWETCGGVAPPGSIPVTYEIIGGGGGGGGQTSAGGTGGAGGAGQTTSISFTPGTGLSNASSGGGAGGPTAVVNVTAGEASAYGPGGVAGTSGHPSNTAGGNAPSTSYGAGGGGAGAGDFSVDGIGEYTGGQGGSAANRISSGQLNSSTGTCTIIVGARGDGGVGTFGANQSGLTPKPGGNGANGYAKITVDGIVYEYTAPGTYTVDIVSSNNVETVTYEMIGGGGGGGAGMNNGNGVGLDDGDDGGSSSISLFNSSGGNFFFRNVGGGFGGAASSLGHSDDNSGEASVFGAGGANSGRENPGNDAPTTSHGAAGGGGGGRRQTNTFGGVYNTDPGGAGGLASVANNGSEQVSLPAGTGLTIVVGEGGVGGNDGGTTGGDGASGRVSINLLDRNFIFDATGTYTIDPLVKAVTYEIIGGGGEGAGGYLGGTGNAGGDSTLSPLQNSSSTQFPTVTSTGGAGGTQPAPFNGQFRVGEAGQTSYYGSGGAGGVNSDSNNQTPGFPAAATSYGAGGGGGGAYTFAANNGGGGGKAATRMTGTLNLVVGSQIDVVIGAGGSGNAGGGDGAGGYAKITVDGIDTFFTSDGTFTLN